MAQKNQGKIYVDNPKIQYLSPPDRGLWILSEFGITYTINEMLGIKLADGLYDEGNVRYLKTFNKDKGLRCNLPYILHHADMTTTRIEYEQWLHQNDEEENKQEEKLKEIKNEFNKLFV